MNKYQFKNKTQLGIAYYYCYGDDRFENWLRIKNIKFKSRRSKGTGSRDDGLRRSRVVRSWRTARIPEPIGANWNKDLPRREVKSPMPPPCPCRTTVCLVSPPGWWRKKNGFRTGWCGSRIHGLWEPLPSCPGTSDEVSGGGRDFSSDGDSGRYLLSS